MFASKPQGLTALLLAAGVLAGGAARLASQEAAQTEIGRDRHGDPLPRGAVARLGTLRFRCPGEVQTLAFAPDGKTIAAAWRGGLLLFEAPSGKRIRHLASSLPYGLEYSIAFSPDSKRLACLEPRDSQGKSVVRILELAAGGKPRAYDAEHVFWLGWSTDGEPLALCMETGAVRLQELAAGRSRRFACPDLPRPEPVTSVIFAIAPGRTLAVADSQHKVHVWDAVTGRERCTVQFGKAYLHCLTIACDGRHLASLTYEVENHRPTDRTAVQIWDTTNGKDLRTVAADQRKLFTVAFAPDGKTLATAGARGIRFWDVATGRQRSRSEGPGSNTQRITFSADARTLAAMENNTVAFHLWDVASGEQKPEPPGHTCQPNGTAFFPDGRLATGGGWDGTIHIWDQTTSASLLRIQRRSQRLQSIDLSPDGRALYSAWTDENLWVSDAATGERQHVIKLEDPEWPDTYQSASFLHLSADGNTLVALSSYRSRTSRVLPRGTLITAWDPRTRKQLFRRTRPALESLTALSADARVLAVSSPPSGGRGSGAGPMRLEDLASGDLLLTFPELAGATWPLAFSPDGRLLAVNHFDYTHSPDSSRHSLRLWEVATAAEVLSLPSGGQGWAAFSADGRLVAVTAAAQGILVWDLAQNRSLRRLEGFDALVTWLVFAPDGRRLISGHSDSTLLIWDLGSRAPAQPGAGGAVDAARAWSDLAGGDAPRAIRARWALAASPETALPLLKQHLKPSRPANAQQLRRFVADLDSARFAVRKQAQQELEAMAELAAPALRQALAQQSSLEVRRRIEGLLARLQGPVTQPQTVRALRALAVLEDIASPDARQVLERLAQGAPESRLTQEARAALNRLDRHAR